MFKENKGYSVKLKDLKKKNTLYIKYIIKLESENKDHKIQGKDIKVKVFDILFYHPFHRYLQCTKNTTAIEEVHKTFISLHHNPITTLKPLKTFLAIPKKLGFLLG